MSLSVIQGPIDVQGNPPGAYTVTGSVGLNQVMIAIASGGTLPSGASVSDNVNTGNYSLLASYLAGNIAIYWKITNATNAGSTLITLATPGGYSYLSGGAITGFLGTPTSDAALIATATGTSAAPAINATNNFNNEVMLVGFSNANAYSNALTVSGWTPITSSGGTTQPGYYSIEATSGTANNFSGTITSQQWWLLVAGIYDLVAGVAPPSPFYYRKNVLYFI